MRAPGETASWDGITWGAGSWSAFGSDREALDGLVSAVRGRGGDPWGRGRDDDTDENPWGSYPEGDQRTAAERRRGIPQRPPRRERPPEEPAAPELADEPHPVDDVAAGGPPPPPPEPSAADEPATEELEPVRPAIPAAMEAPRIEAEPAAEMSPQGALPGRSPEDDLAGLVRPQRQRSTASGSARPPAPGPSPDTGPTRGRDERAEARPPATPAQPRGAKALPAQPPRASGRQPAGPQPPSGPPPPPSGPPAPPAVPPPPPAGTPPPGPPPPPHDAPPPGPPAAPKGLRDQFGRTKASALGLVRAHTELAKAELAEIMDEFKRLAVVIGLGIGCGIFVGLLIPIGLTLFFGEWLFGSIGWGILHGAQVSLAVVVAALVAYLGLSRRAFLGALLAAVIAGLVFGVVFGFNLSNGLWKSIGDAAFAALGPDSRPLLVGVGVMAAAVGILAFIAGLRGGIGSAIGGLIIGAILGALLGAFSAITFGRQVGAALGVSIGLLLWPLFLAFALRRQGVDFDAIKARLWPAVTIQTTKETIEWVRERTPLGPKS